MMVFSSLFSTYLRYRTGIENCEALFSSGVFTEGQACWLPASYFIAEGGYHQADAHAALGFMPDTLIPGAINTFALIVSSYTIVLALKTAKDASLSDSERNSKVGKYLLATLALATLFLIFKMVEWFIGFYVPEISAFGLHEHDIISLVDEGYTINADHYQHHSYVDEAPGAHMVADIQVSASLFYVTTGTHGAHVAGGIIGLSYMTYKAWLGGYTPKNAVSIEYFGLYWHFVDLIWVLVFPFFYLY